MKRIFKFLLFVALITGVERFCHKQTRGFALSNIFPDTELVGEEELHPQARALLSQPFTFLESGLECYAFVGEDGETVLKLFKHHHLRQAYWLARVPFLKNIGEKLVKEKAERLEKGFASCALAEKELKAETGMIYFHNRRTEKCPVTLIDKLGICHVADVGGIPFLVQKKGTLLVPTLEKCMERGEIERAKECVRSLLTLIHERCKKGIADRDPTLCKNFGFVGTKAIVIDVGSFSYSPALQDEWKGKRELFDETLPLRCLLRKNFPALVDFFEQELERMIRT